MTGTRRDPSGDAPARNRGPAAAAGNRRALVAAAREVFAESGIDAPLRTVAQRAGVGQGSLYRHFPDRISLVLAVFEENVAALQARAADPAATLDDVLDLVDEQVVASAGFVDALTAEATHPDVLAVVDRVRTLLERKLAAAAPGTVRPGVGADDLLLAFSMLTGAVERTPPADRAQTARRAWWLLRPGLFVTDARSPRPGADGGDGAGSLP